MVSLNKRYPYVQHMPSRRGYEKMMSAADKGHPEASVIVATQRLFGSQFLKENPVQGIDNLRKLADKGIASAQRVCLIIYIVVVRVNNNIRVSIKPGYFIRISISILIYQVINISLSLIYQFFSFIYIVI